MLNGENKVLSLWYINKTPLWYLCWFWDVSWQNSTCDDNSEASYATEINKHTACEFPISVKI